MHWYNSEGESRHTIIGKNGKERTTSIRDARALGYFPSVTTIQDVKAKPALIQWLQTELMNAAIENPWHPENGQDVSIWKKQMLAKMREKGEKAAKRGTEIHGYLDDYFSKGVLPTSSREFIIPVIDFIDSNFGLDGWVSEKSFCRQDKGYAGCVDLHHPEKNIIIDFKTKDKTDLKDMVQYDDHRIQLAAYQTGLNMPETTRRFNLFISVSPETPGLCKLVECTEFDKNWNIFYNLLNVWKLVNNYDPAEAYHGEQFRENTSDAGLS